MNALEQLKQFTSVVADTGDVDSIAQYQPDDATTNPSLILKALKQNPDSELLGEAEALAKQLQLPTAMCLTALYGREISRLVPGYVSTEVDPRLSFDQAATVEQAKAFIQLYQQLGVDTQRILIKIAATWEGIQAARQLEADNIKTNITLLFAPVQAMAAAQAGATLISPFVGRILDWYKANQPEALEQGDPGVASVRTIFQAFKKYGYNTIVMGASFRSSEQIIALAGCDKLTISPALLSELQNSQQEVIQQLSGSADGSHAEVVTEAAFRWQLNEDAMATEKLAEGIRLFSRDIETLENMVASR
ncbi:transaldolase family protein [Salinibius halmophilus]|uniref:transaldolase family protein n=1 Tax=Salinibius halmophilus TaxID=1853216 RepID=UPI000E65F537|nr:transaldolase family protein [Salinibius halmophilus]